MRTYLFSLMAGLALASGGSLLRATAVDSSAIHIIRLPSGLRVGLIGDHGPWPAPTLFVFQGSLENAEETPIYTEVVRRLWRHGFLGVLLDAPAHGEDRLPGEPPELAAWCARVDHRQDFVGVFTSRARGVLDYLIRERYTDPEKVAACGTSRGGFLAFQFAAADPRIKLVAGISPVTDLLALREFHHATDRERAEKLSLIRLAPRLAGRPIWLSIGNHDIRVDTGDVIAFARALVRVDAEGKDDNAVIPVTLIVAPTGGHTNIEDAHELLAHWILKQFGLPEGARP